MSLLHISELPPQRSDEALALAWLGSGCSDTEWADLLQKGERAQCGLLCATALGGVLLGLASYEVRQEGLLGRILRVGLFVAFELGGKGSTRAALRAALDQLGERLGCGAVLFTQDARGLTQTALF